MVVLLLQVSRDAASQIPRQCFCFSSAAEAEVHQRNVCEEEQDSGERLPAAAAPPAWAHL